MDVLVILVIRDTSIKHYRSLPLLPGSVKVWDARQKDVPVACMEPADGEMRRDCWTVSFGKGSEGIKSGMSSEGRMWDGSLIGL